MPHKQECKPSQDIFNLQQSWLLACADFDHAKGAPKQRAAINKMQRVLRLMQQAHPREIGPHKHAYERRLERMAGVKLPRHAEHHHKPPAKGTAKKSAAKKRR
jgi:hypothetical protein